MPKKLHFLKNPNYFLLGSNHQLQHQTIQENQQSEDLEPRVTFFLIDEPKAYVVNEIDIFKAVDKYLSRYVLH